MGLSAKFNLMLVLTFAVAFAIAAVVSKQIVLAEARREMRHDAAMMMAQADAIHQYTVKEIAPLVEPANGRLVPQLIPFWAAPTLMRLVAKPFPNYTYKEVALNPTNANNRAADWQSYIIAGFQQSPALEEFESTRMTPVGEVLSLARPIRVTDATCLTCHSSPTVAPATLLATYGTQHGFGWKLGDIVGAQIASVPMQEALARADRTFMFYLSDLALVFALTFGLLNVMLHFSVIRPLRRMFTAANAASVGHVSPEFELQGRDEIAKLSQSFNRMRRSLANAMQLLEPGS